MHSSESDSSGTEDRPVNMKAFVNSVADSKKKKTKSTSAPARTASGDHPPKSKKPDKRSRKHHEAEAAKLPPHMRVVRKGTVFDSDPALFKGDKPSINVARNDLFEMFDTNTGEVHWMYWTKKGGPRDATRVMMDAITKGVDAAAARTHFNRVPGTDSWEDELAYYPDRYFFSKFRKPKTNPMAPVPNRLRTDGPQGPHTFVSAETLRACLESFGARYGKPAPKKAADPAAGSAEDSEPEQEHDEGDEEEKAGTARQRPEHMRLDSKGGQTEVEKLLEDLRLNYIEPDAWNKLVLGKSKVAKVLSARVYELEKPSPGDAPGKGSPHAKNGAQPRGDKKGGVQATAVTRGARGGDEDGGRGGEESGEEEEPAKKASGGKKARGEGADRGGDRAEDSDGETGAKTKARGRDGKRDKDGEKEKGREEKEKGKDKGKAKENGKAKAGANDEGGRKEGKNKEPKRDSKGKKAEEAQKEREEDEEEQSEGEGNGKGKKSKSKEKERDRANKKRKSEDNAKGDEGEKRKGKGKGKGKGGEKAEAKDEDAEEEEEGGEDDGDEDEGAGEDAKDRNRKSKSRDRSRDAASNGDHKKKRKGSRKRDRESGDGSEGEGDGEREARTDAREASAEAKKGQGKKGRDGARKKGKDKPRGKRTEEDEEEKGAEEVATNEGTSSSEAEEPPRKRSRGAEDSGGDEPDWTKVMSVPEAAAELYTRGVAIEGFLSDYAVKPMSSLPKEMSLSDFAAQLCRPDSNMYCTFGFYHAGFAKASSLAEERAANVASEFSKELAEEKAAREGAQQELAEEQAAREGVQKDLASATSKLKASKKICGSLREENESLRAGQKKHEDLMDELRKECMAAVESKAKLEGQLKKARDEVSAASGKKAQRGSAEQLEKMKSIFSAKKAE